MKIRTKLGLGFGMQVALATVLGVSVLFGMLAVKRQFSFVVEHDAPVMANARQLSKLVVDMETGQRGFCITHREEFLEPYTTGAKEFGALIEEQKKLVGDNPSQVAALERIERLVHQWKEKAVEPEIAARREMNEHPESLKDVAALLQAGTGKALLDEIRRKFDEFIEIETRLTAQRYRIASRTTALTRNLAAGLLVLAICAGVVVAVLISHAIAHPLAELARGAEAVGSGDLDTQIEVRSSDEIGVLARAFNAMASNLEEAAFMRKQAEEALRVAKDYTDNILKSMTDILVVVASDGRLATVNDACCALLGYQAEELIGQPASLLFSEEEEEEATAQFILFQDTLPVKRSVLRRLANDGSISNVEKSLLTKSGDRIPVLLSGAVMRDDEDAIGGIVCLALDITQRKQAEATQLRFLERLERTTRLSEELIQPGRLEEKLRNVTEAAVEILDLDFCRIWIVKTADLCDAGCIHAKVTEGPHVCRHREECLHLVASSGRYTHIDGGHRRVPFGCYKIGRIATGDDHKFLVNDVTTDPRVHDRQWAERIGLVSFAGYKLRDAQGFPVGVLAMFSKHPLTEEDDAHLSHLAETTSEVILAARAEETLRRAREEATAANIAKSEFLANMSHEIRTPMTAILGFSDVLMESVTNREQFDAATTIKQNGEYLLGLINDILDLSKIEAGKLEIEHIQCSPCQILSEVVSLMRVRANAKNLPLEIEYDGPIPQSIQSDPTRLRQILINLTGNAVKFTEVGKIRLVARLLEAESDQPKMQFEVVDSGIGMTEEQITRLFKPFSQVDSSTTRTHGGTGLGLAISKRLAEKLDGDINVRSRPGEGTTFILTVGTGPLDGVKLLDNPTEAEVSMDPEKKPAAPETKLDCRVLLAEDDPDNQRLIAFLLKKAGAEVVVADNGRIAHDLALAARDEGSPFDVILMDMQMPVMDGYDATGKLREAGYSGPIIALTAHAMSTDRDKCLHAGCDDYMTKPIDRQKLVALTGHYADKPSRPKLTEAGDTRAPTLAKAEDRS